MKNPKAKTSILEEHLYPISNIVYDYKVYFVFMGHRDKVNYSGLTETLGELRKVSKRELTEKEKKRVEINLTEITTGSGPDWDLSERGKYRMCLPDLSSVELADNRPESPTKGGYIIVKALPLLDNNGETDPMKIVPSLAGFSDENGWHKYLINQNDPRLLGTFIDIMTPELLRFIKMQLEYEGLTHGLDTIRNEHLTTLGRVSPNYSREISNMKRRIKEWKEIEDRKPRYDW